MKRITLGIVLWISILALHGCVSMPTAEEIQQNAYKGESQVVDFSNIDKSKIFDASKIWIAKRFTSANNVIQYSDKEKGTIIGKGNFSLKCPDGVGGLECMAYTSTRAEFTLTIDIKDNKARLTFSDVHQAVNNYPFFDEKSKPAVIKQISELIADYKQDIEKQQNNSNW